MPIFLGIAPTNGYPEALVSSEQNAKDIFVGADASGTGIDMLRAQLLGAKLNALLFPGFADAFLPSGEQVSDVILLADQILNDEANRIPHNKSEIIAVKDLLDSANNNSHTPILLTCEPPNATPTQTPTATPTVTPTATQTPGPCQSFSGGLTKGYWKTHTGLDSPERDAAYDGLPIFLGVSPSNGPPEMLVATEEDARDVLSNANSSGHGYTMLRAQLLAAELNALKFSGFEAASFSTGEIVGDVMADAHQLLNDAANGVSHPKDEIILLSDLLDRANGNSQTSVLTTCPTLPLPAATATDYDGDGFSDEVEALHLGTNSTASCGSGGWPADLVPGGIQPNTLNIQDFGSFVAPVFRINTSPGDAGYDARWDLLPGSAAGKWLNLQDIAALVAGPTAHPAMFGGQPAFGKSCITATDDDNDRVGNQFDNCPQKANPDQANWDADPRGDVCDDDDGDGFVDSMEFYVGTDPLDRCSYTGWPANFVDAGPSKNKINLQDLASYLSPIRHFNTSPGEAGYDTRWDLIPGSGGFGKDINLVDLGLVATFKPPMFGGAKAFNGPNC